MFFCYRTRGIPRGSFSIPIRRNIHRHSYHQRCSHSVQSIDHQRIYKWSYPLAHHSSNGVPSLGCRFWILAVSFAADAVRHDSNTFSHTCIVNYIRRCRLGLGLVIAWIHSRPDRLAYLDCRIVHRRALVSSIDIWFCPVNRQTDVTGLPYGPLSIQRLPCNRLRNHSRTWNLYRDSSWLLRLVHVWQNKHMAVASYCHRNWRTVQPLVHMHPTNPSNWKKKWNSTLRSIDRLPYLFLHNGSVNDIFGQAMNHEVKVKIVNVQRTSRFA